MRTLLQKGAVRSLLLRTLRWAADHNVGVDAEAWARAVHACWQEATDVNCDQLAHGLQSLFAGIQHPTFVLWGMPVPWKGAFHLFSL